jgi:DNA primase
MQGQFDEETLDTIFAALGIQFQHVNGYEHIGFCPDYWGMHKHGDRTGKFSFNYKKCIGNCYVCGACPLIRLVMAARGIAYDEAEVWLNGFGKYDERVEGFMHRLEATMGDKSETEYEPNVLDASILDKWLCDDHPWFEERGIIEEVAKRFCLGQNPKSIFPTKDKLYEGPTIVIPHFWKWDLVGYQNRWLEYPNCPAPKYTNSKNFCRKETLWGYDYVALEDVPVIVESVPTALKLYSLGYSAVATFGSNVTETQIRLLRVFDQGIIIAEDNDAPGSKWRDLIIEGVRDYVPISKISVDGAIGLDLGDLCSDEIHHKIDKAIPTL